MGVVDDNQVRQTAAGDLWNFMKRSTQQSVNIAAE